MGFTLEIMIVPVLLLTAITTVLVATEASFGVAAAGVVGMAVLYFVVVNALRTARREEDEEGDDQSIDD